VIDPIATVIAYLASAAPVAAATSGRVAAKHKFALPGDRDGAARDAWPVPSRALRVQAGGGTPDISTSRHVLDLSLTAFGASQADAMAVVNAVQAVIRAHQRSRVPTADGDALLYSLTVVSPAVFGFEPIGDQIGVDTVSITLRAAVAECAIP
jgi:hypothetical protein